MVIGGYEGLQVDTRDDGGLQRIAGGYRAYTGEYKGLKGCQGGYRGLQGVIEAYTGLQEGTRGYRRLHGVTGG